MLQQSAPDRPRLLSVAVAGLAEIPPELFSAALQQYWETCSCTSIPRAFHIVPCTFATACTASAPSAAGFAGRGHGRAALGPCRSGCVALPSTSKATGPQSCQELIPQAGADPASFGATVQCRGAAAGRDCSLGCRGDKSFVSAGHLFSSSSRGTGLPEGICLRIPVKA